jgi:hypothetical protein
VRCQYRRDPHPLDDECVDVADAYTDDELETGLRRVVAAIDGLPPKVEARPAGRDDFDCSPYPEGDGRHDYRITASSHYGIGLERPDYRAGETCYRCRRCGDVFVVLDFELAAMDEERRDG